MDISLLYKVCVKTDMDRHKIIETLVGFNDPIRPFNLYIQVGSFLNHDHNYTYLKLIDLGYKSSAIGRALKAGIYPDDINGLIQFIEFEKETSETYTNDNNDPVYIIRAQHADYFQQHIHSLMIKLMQQLADYKSNPSDLNELKREINDCNTEYRDYLARHNKFKLDFHQTYYTLIDMGYTKDQAIDATSYCPDDIDSALCRVQFATESINIWKQALPSGFKIKQTWDMDGDSKFIAFPEQKETDNMRSTETDQQYHEEYKKYQNECNQNSQMAITFKSNELIQNSVNTKHIEYKICKMNE
eukprot:546737_1